MANTYFKYSKKEVGVTVDLTLTTIDNAEDNEIFLELTLPQLGNSIYISLTTQEQNDLINGILESRGQTAIIMDKSGDVISANNDAKSIIHPAD